MIVLCLGLVFNGTGQLQANENRTKIFGLMLLCACGIYVYKRLAAEKLESKVTENNQQSSDDKTSSCANELINPAEFTPEQNILGEHQNIGKSAENNQISDPYVPEKQDNFFIKFLKYFKNKIRMHQ